MLKKKRLGQFYTTNCKYILKDLNIPPYIQNIIEPFAGNGDLLNFVRKKNVECYDIDPRHSYIKKRDTLLNPPKYRDKFIITNPPFLARNKSDNKEIFDKYGENDLYKCFLRNLITNKSLGGILIIPLNFWCSIRKKDRKLRSDFLKIYNILNLNIFEEQVFNDTKCPISSFDYEIKNEERLINVNIYPKLINFEVKLTELNNYMIGGEIYNLIPNKRYKIGRLTKKGEKSTNIQMKCIDDNKKNKLGLSIVEDGDIYMDGTKDNSSRSYGCLVIVPCLSLDVQKDLVIRFNKLVEDYREKYYSLFLSNYRESKDICRKRISFDLVYKIVGYLLL